MIKDLTVVCYVCSYVCRSSHVESSEVFERRSDPSNEQLDRQQPDGESQAFGINVVNQTLLIFKFLLTMIVKPDRCQMI